MILKVKHDRAVLICANALTVLRELPSDSIDALITDPPAGIGFMGKAWDGAKGGRDKWIAWLAEIMGEARRVLKPGAHGLVWALPRTSHWTATALENAGFEIRDRVSHLFGTGFPKSRNVSIDLDKIAGAERVIVGPNPNARPIDGHGAGYSGATSHREHVTAAASESAQHWDGWGTALKPACEDWWLVRKPFEGTIARNLLTHGVGAINIDACRVGASPGRFPAHIILDPATAEMLDASVPREGKSGDGYGMTHTGAEYTDSGGPSRFFYVAKPNRKEKDAGVTREPLTGGEATGRKDGSKGTQNPRAGAGRTGGARNSHPTVKGKALMKWLIELITPVGGSVLDPFTGSGSTGVAAIENGFKFFGTEQSDEYADIAADRIKYTLNKHICRGCSEGIGCLFPIPCLP